MATPTLLERNTHNSRDREASDQTKHENVNISVGGCDTSSDTCHRLGEHNALATQAREHRLCSRNLEMLMLHHHRDTLAKGLLHIPTT